MILDEHIIAWGHEDPDPSFPGGGWWFECERCGVHAGYKTEKSCETDARLHSAFGCEWD